MGRVCVGGGVGGVGGARESNVKGEGNAKSSESKRASVRGVKGAVVCVGGRVVGARVGSEAVGAFVGVCLSRRVVVV